MKTVAGTLGVARSNLIERRDKVTQARGSYRKAEDAGLLPPIRAIIDERPTYAYRRVWASLEPPSTQRWQAHGQHEAGAPDHAEPWTDTRTPYRPVVLAARMMGLSLRCTRISDGAVRAVGCGRLKLSELSAPLIREFEDKLRTGKPAPGEAEGQARSPAMAKKIRSS